MNKEINENRVGIYAQKSTEVTAVGDGLNLKEVKSPVTEQEKQEEEQDNNMLSANEKVLFVRGAERDKINKATKLERFLLNEEYYGKERCDKALQCLQKLKFVNWEINTMFAALDKFPKNGPKRKSLEKELDSQEDMKKKTRLDDVSKEEEEKLKEKEEEENVAKPEVISGILLKEKYSTFDLRANIGDGSHPNFHILPEQRTKVYLEFHKFLRQNFQDDPVVCSYFVNQNLMIECRNAQILEQIDKNICMLDRLCPGGDFAMIPRSSESKNIQICIPYSYTDVTEVLEIIKKQNRLPVDKWKVNNSKNSEDGICLDVEVDGGTYLRLMQDQDDIFFLMKKATIKLLEKDES